jgi:hypothetical protein
MFVDLGKRPVGRYEDGHRYSLPIEVEGRAISN